MRSRERALEPGRCDRRVLSARAASQRNSSARREGLEGIQGAVKKMYLTSRRNRDAKYGLVVPGRPDRRVLSV